jgi:hypothetical protein
MRALAGISPYPIATPPPVPTLSAGEAEEGGLYQTGQRMRAAGRLCPRSTAVIRTAQRPEPGKAGALWPGSRPALKVPPDATSPDR